MASAKLERRLHRCSSYFLHYAKDVHSQGGEDGILQELFSRIGTSNNKYCVDVGAWDGQWLSNTYELLHSTDENAWGGLLIEANPQRAQEAAHLYASHPRVTTLSTLVTLDGPSSLSQLLMQYNVPRDFDFLSIDIDGADYYVWQGLRDSDYQPRVVCIEFNPTIPNTVYFIQEKDISVQQGSSLLALKELGLSLGYTLIVTTTFNAIFIRDELMTLLPTIYNSLDALHVSTMTTEMFQTYDGELKFVGSLKLHWHKIGVNPEKLQVLKKKDRKFPFAPPSAHSIVRLMELMPLIAAPRDEPNLRGDTQQLLEELRTIAPNNTLQGYFREALLVMAYTLDCLSDNASYTLYCIETYSAMFGILEARMQQLDSIDVVAVKDLADTSFFMICQARGHPRLRSVYAYGEEYCRAVLRFIRLHRRKGDGLAAQHLLKSVEFVDALAAIPVETRRGYLAEMERERGRVQEITKGAMATFNIKVFPIKGPPPVTSRRFAGNRYLTAAIVSAVISISGYLLCKIQRNLWR